MRLSCIILQVAVFPLLLTGCGPEPAGEPVMRTEIGSGQADTVAAPEPEPTEAVATSACTRVNFEDVPLTHCIADPARHVVSMDLSPAGGSPYRSFAALAAARSPDAPGVAFAMNGGMYDAEGKPIGYYVENSERLKELSRADGPGNFHLKPNGVFYGTGGKWQIRTAEDFYAQVGDRPQFGTQSGPMLVIGGSLHPEITEDGPSRMIRNGVGIDAGGRAHFVISEGPLSFGKLARFYRDVLKTPNALYLDGNVSALWDPATGRMDGSVPIGPLIVVENRQKAPS
ncbi:phosphodiester glycosidase family protein [Allopontixanthobacter sp.]|uniref:phosphodiester glycosidase family protein n=1 Tax=Allopontixanthobacter sp. TaxID=2906452 RepID=UPI002ABBDA2F|nr:phosphodiester glycosidase family protein [Allopontixanthobacter sp.]MDZ4306554.1 phosphodiester glycosidase family protein [Allopontixanthobacter sp.]